MAVHVLLIETLRRLICFIMHVRTYIFYQRRVESLNLLLNLLNAFFRKPNEENVSMNGKGYVIF